MCKLIVEIKIVKKGNYSFKNGPIKHEMFMGIDHLHISDFDSKIIYFAGVISL